MSVAETVETVEDLENEVESSDSPKRGRGAAPKVNYQTIFTDEETGKANPPKSETGEVAEGYRMYTLQVISAPQLGVNQYVYARSQDQATAFILSQYVTCDVTDPQQRGKPKKIDPIYLSYLKTLKKQKLTSEIDAFLVEYPHYKSHIDSYTP